MTTPANTKWKWGATPGKLALVGVLFVLLVVSLVVNVGGSLSAGGAAAGGAQSVKRDRPRRNVPRNNNQAARPQRDTRTRPVSRQTPPPAGDQARPLAPVTWPKMSPNEAAIHDPFALPEPLRQAVFPPQADTVNPVSAAGSHDPPNDSQPKPTGPTEAEQAEAAAQARRREAEAAAKRAAELAQQRRQDELIQLQGTVLSLKEAGVDLILQTSRGAIAKIGNRTVEVGDRLGGWRVTKIDTTGIVVEMAPETQPSVPTSGEPDDNR